MSEYREGGYTRRPGTVIGCVYNGEYVIRSRFSMIIIGNLNRSDDE